MYSFDPVGSYEREACRAAGAAQSLVQPFLDNQVWGGRVFALNVLSYHLPDLLQEPDASAWDIASNPSASAPRTRACYRLVYLCD